jgi:hypothetical protein
VEPERYNRPGPGSRDLTPRPALKKEREFGTATGETCLTAWKDLETLGAMGPKSPQDSA